MCSILQENRTYWTHRADGYSKVNQQELASRSHHAWQKVLRERLERHFPGKALHELHILEVGTGPGFFAILLTELGCQVTAIDLTASMLAEARSNAGALANKIRFLEMNAEELAFEDHSFDGILTRNLTWNLPHPDAAYREWCRVLKPDGLLLNFDANWYGYLFDPAAQAAYEQDRENSARLGMDDQNVGENFDIMEKIAAQLPLSSIRRPVWDTRVLSSMGMHTTVERDIWQHVWTEEEKTNFASTPMFLIQAVKAS